jgi:transcription initiation factor IIE alpha subunit
MAEIIITVSQEEKDAVVAAIQQLSVIPHIKKMSQAMIAETAGIKATKIRAVLQELIDEKKVSQYAATDNPKLQRYFYTVNEPASEMQ